MNHHIIIRWFVVLAVCWLCMTILFFVERQEKDDLYDHINLCQEDQFVSWNNYPVNDPDDLKCVDNTD